MSAKQNIAGLLVKLGFLNAPKPDRRNNDEQAHENYLEGQTLRSKLLPGRIWLNNEKQVPLGKLNKMDLNQDPSCPLYLMEINEEEGTATISMNMEC